MTVLGIGVIVKHAALLLCPLHLDVFKKKKDEEKEPVIEALSIHHAQETC